MAIACELIGKILSTSFAVIDRERGHFAFVVRHGPFACLVFLEAGDVCACACVYCSSGVAYGKASESTNEQRHGIIDDFYVGDKRRETIIVCVCVCSLGPVILNRIPRAKQSDKIDR